MSTEKAESGGVTRRWRGVPPEGVEVRASDLPIWSESHRFTQETARALLTEHYGADWRLQEQVTVDPPWVEISTPPGETS